MSEYADTSTNTKSVSHLSAEKNNKLKEKFTAYCINLGVIMACKLLSQKEDFPLKKTELDVFNRYLKSCNNDGHTLKTEYWDSDKSKLMFVSVFNKKGQKDGPSIHVSDDGKEVSYGWYRKDKPHGKWIKHSKDGYFTFYQRILNKEGKNISPSTGISAGKLTKFINHVGKYSYIENIISNGKPTAEYKKTMRQRIKDMHEAGKSGVILVDKRLEETRRKLEALKAKENPTITSETTEEVAKVTAKAPNKGLNIAGRLHNLEND